MSPRPHRPIGRRARRGLLPAALAAALALLAAGCTPGGTLPRTRAGLAHGDAERLSLIVAQSRAQFPDLSAVALRQGPYRPQDDRETAEPTLALRGEGTGVRPGVQRGQAETVSLELYLDKSHYDAGHLRLQRGGGPAETWRVIAHDLRGDVTEDFELILTLADGENRVRYLVVLGGRYPAEEPSYIAYEGTLLFPGKGVRLDQWPLLYKVDFGFRHPSPPEYQGLVDESGERLQALDEAVSELFEISNRISEQQEQLEQLARKEVPPEQRDAHTLELERRRQRIADLRAELRGKARQTEADMIAYYELRARIARSYAAFVETNPYLWRDTEGRQAHYDYWKQVEFQHPRIDTLHVSLVSYLDDAGDLEQAKEDAFRVIDRLDNWSRNPSRQPTQPPPSDAGAAGQAPAAAPDAGPSATPGGAPDGQGGAPDDAAGN